MSAAETLELVLSRRLIPVIVASGQVEAENLASALVDGGLPVAEVTLRTEDALIVIARLAEDPRMFVGAGTVTTERQFFAAIEAGARFVVSPGLSDAVIAAAHASDIPLLPGAVTATEVMRAVDCGIETVKFFPAESQGGAAAIKALAGPFPGVRFVPTGGLTAANVGSYLALPSVPAAGGSWMVPRELTGDPTKVTELTSLVRSAVAAL